jgi:molybdate transport system regulatory protein
LIKTGIFMKNAWLLDNELLHQNKIDLLEEIDRCGSILKASKALKITYKTAWNWVDTINNLSNEVVIENSGVNKSSGSRLSPYGRDILKKFKIIKDEHREFIENLSSKIDYDTDILKIYERLMMKVSARNQLLGSVINIKTGKVNSEVVISVGANQITSVVTNESVTELGIKIGSEVYAIIKASSVLVSKEDLKISARNRLKGIVSAVIEGEVNVEIKIALSEKLTISSIITKDSLNDLNIKAGDSLFAIIKSSSVILGVE